MSKMNIKYDILSSEKTDTKIIEPKTIKKNNNYSIFRYKIYFKIIFFIISILLLFFIILYLYKRIQLTNTTIDDENKINHNSNNEENKMNEENEKNPQIYYIGKKAYFTKQTITRFNKYIDVCRKGELIDNKIYNLSSTPKISVIMPLFNAKNYLYYSLRSIQNQRMKDIEIILINDCSTDDTLKEVEKYMKEDPRIRLINNEENRRILYSKSIGALYANGKYIIQLDQDDMFITEEAFDSLYEEAEKNNLDLIQFRDVIIEKFHFSDKIEAFNYQYTSHHEEEYLHQPYIKEAFSTTYNFLLWGLLIKLYYYKKAVHIL